MPMVAPPTWRESNQPSLQETQGGSPRLFSAVLSSIRKPRQVSGCGFVHRSPRNYYTNYYTVSVPPATQATYPSGLITASGLANVYNTRLMGSRPPRSPPC